MCLALFVPGLLPLSVTSANSLASFNLGLALFVIVSCYSVSIAYMQKKKDYGRFLLTACIDSLSILHAPIHLAYMYVLQAFIHSA